jgi:predicted transporter
MFQPWIAALVSAVLPGAGQFLNQHWLRGLAFLTGALIASGMLRRRSLLSAPFSDGSIVHFVLLAVLFLLAGWSAVDAFRSRMRAHVP